MPDSEASVSQSTAWRALEVNVLSSSIAGCVARFICHPIDTVKSRIQAPATRSAEFDGVYKAFRTTISEEGVAGLYRGVGAVLLGGIPATSVYLTGYEVSKSILGQFDFFQESPFLAYFCSGMLAEVLSCVIFVPVDVVKERLQVQRSPKYAMTRTKTPYNIATDASSNYKGSMHALRTIFKEEGVRGVYRGYGATLFSFGPFSAFYFLLYEELKKFISSKAAIDKNDMPFGWTLFCSAAAGAGASVVTNPLDLIKLRLQLSRGKKDATTSLFSVFSSSVKSDGFFGLFRGAGARVAFHGPNVAITMTVFDFVKARLNE